MERIVVPFTTVDASHAVAALAARPSVEIVAVAVDVGQAPALDELRDAALASGAVRCHAFELRERLAQRFLWPALRAGALGAPGEPVVTALSAPCIAEAVVEVARLEHASAVAAVSGDPRQRQRLHASMRAIASGIGVVAVPSAAAAPAERNIWGRVTAQASDAGAAGDERAGRGPAAQVPIRFDKGVPVELSGVPMSPAELIDSLATIARSHGVGGIVVEGEPGEARQWVVHAPAAVALHRAGAALTARVLDDRAAAFAATVAGEYAALVRDGEWFSPLRAGLEAFVAQALDLATGEVLVRFEHGQIGVQT
jgi:argininosuccinate synthase